MKKKDLLKNIQEYFATFKEDINFIKNEKEFKEAIRYLDEEALNEVIKKGFNVTEFEKQNGSTLVKAIYDCSDIMLSIFKKYWPKKYIHYYFNVLPNVKKDELAQPVKNEMNSAINSLIKVMDILYSNGADINARDIKVEKDTIKGILLDDSIVLETSSPFSVIIKNLEQFQSIELVAWFIGKEGFDLNREQDVISKLVRFDSELSTQVLNMLLLSGLKLQDYTDLTTNDIYSSLHECAIAGGNKTKNEKLQLLYQFATSEQKTCYIEDFELIKKEQNEETTYSK